VVDTGYHSDDDCLCSWKNRFLKKKWIKMEIRTEEIKTLTQHIRAVQFLLHQLIDHLELYKELPEEEHESRNERGTKIEKYGRK
jgi:hypothetical protein